MKLLSSLLLSAAFLSATCAGATGLTENIQKQHVQAELFVSRTSYKDKDSGENLMRVGVKLTPEPGWHTYWKNPGDSGLATTLKWENPPNVKIGEIQWAAPKKIKLDTMVNYGYEEAVLLSSSLKILPVTNPQDSSTPSFLPIQVKVNWLACKEECIPESTVLKTDIKFGVAHNGSKPSEKEVLSLFEEEEKRIPLQVTGAASATVSEDGTHLSVRIEGLPAGVKGNRLEAFPELENVIQPSGEWIQAWEDGVWTAKFPVGIAPANPGSLAFVLTSGEKSWRAVAKTDGRWALPTSKAVETSTSNQSISYTTKEPKTQGSSGDPTRGVFIIALIGALLGGLILNLMPCVFPILTIKVMGIARHAHDTKEHRQIGLAYGLGVVVSFIALGALMLSMRAAGQQVGWGFQLQSPWMVSGLAVLFTLLGLNLLGLFEFWRLVPNCLATAEAKHPVINSFLSGVLAVAIASPCTGPFMGASLGLTLVMPAGQALMIFAAIGLGMALPLVLVSFMPVIAQAFPKPGAWMEKFRQGLAFPMLGTVIWLLWILGLQTSTDVLVVFLAALVALSFVLWSLTLSGKTRNAVFACTLVLFGWLGFNAVDAITKSLTATKMESATVNGSGTKQLNGNAMWAAWSPEAVESELETNHPVFVDFTAAWCVTCQYNKRTTLADPDVIRDFEAKGVRTMRADWTKQDPRITAELAKFGRNGVPTYVMYERGRDPIVLSEILNVMQVKQVIANTSIWLN